MQTRYRHYLYPCQPGHWPSRVLIVDCTSTAQLISEAPARQVERLASIHTIALLRKDESYGIERTCTHTDAAHWWTDLATLLAAPLSTLLVSYQCGRVWSLLGLWERIETGVVRITGRDVCVADTQGTAQRRARQRQSDPLTTPSTQAVSAEAERLRGILVCEDPPNIATIRVHDSAGRATWIDAKNHAVSLPDTCPNGPSTVAALAAWFISYTEALKRAKLGAIQHTAGSQSMHGFRTSYLSWGIYADSSDRRTAAECSGYYGGRCEAFRLGIVGHPAYHFDRRGAYCSHANHDATPIRPIRECVNPSRDTAERAVVSGACCANVTIRTTEPAYPYRRNANGNGTNGGAVGSKQGTPSPGVSDIIFPVGRFRTVLMGPELRDAFLHGRVESCQYLIEYDSAHVLQAYAQAVYEMRCAAERDGNKLLAQSAKALAVSIVGKLCQRQHQWTHCPDHWTDTAWGEWIGSDGKGGHTRYRSVGGTVQRDDIGGLNPDAVPSIAAWITSAARVQLLSYIRAAGWDNVLYVDTDSIIVNGAGAAALYQYQYVVDGMLGALQTPKVYHYMDIRGIKYYIHDSETVCAGAPKGTLADAGDGAHYWYTKHPSGAVHQGQRPEPIRELREYARTAEYRHGVVGDGGRVRPIEIWEED